MEYGEATFCCTVQMSREDLELWREFCEQLNCSQQAVLFPDSSTVETADSNLSIADAAEPVRRDLRNGEPIR